MLTCKQTSNLGTEYLDRSLSFGVKLQFWLHLGMCRHCSTHLHQLEVTTHALSRLESEVEAATAESAEHLIAVLRRTRIAPGDHGS